MGEPEYAVCFEGAGVFMPKSAFTHEGFREWVLSDDFPDGVKATFARGEVLFEVSPEAIRTHSIVKRQMLLALASLAESDDLGESYPDGVLLTHARAGLSTVPDFCFALWETLETGRLREVPRNGDPDDSVELEGTPDLVAEIVSKSSTHKDLTILRETYARAGVPEYWIIDVRKKEARFEILRLDSGAYVASAPREQPQISIVFGRNVALHRSKNRIGRWTYRFEITK
ncbi:Uma2 family endonuclease [Pendulispora brunnea]|uniref:Uma2 family endonuclease n=1 Tax=Pendulispora brunnea TaxID=2905690 RepID=A0ABZ2K9Q6_9BACT